MAATTASHPKITNGIGIGIGIGTRVRLGCSCLTRRPASTSSMATPSTLSSIPNGLLVLNPASTSRRPIRGDSLGGFLTRRRASHLSLRISAAVATEEHVQTSSSGIFIWNSMWHLNMLFPLFFTFLEGFPELGFLICALNLLD